MTLHQGQARSSLAAWTLRDLRHGLRARLHKWRALKSIIYRFAPYLNNRKGGMCVAVVATLGYAATRILSPWPLKMIIDNILLGEHIPFYISDNIPFEQENSLFLLYILIFSILIIAFMRGGFYYLQRIFSASIGNAIATDLRYDLYKHIHGLSFSFHDRRRTGDILVRLTSDIKMLRRALVSLPIRILESALLLVGMAIVMLLMDWQLALIALALLPVIVRLVQLYQRPIRRAVQKQREKEGHLATIASEALTAIRAIQGLRQERSEVQRFGSANQHSRRSNVKVARLEAKLMWSIEIAIAIATGAIILLATFRVLSGALTPGDLIVFTAYLRFFARPLRRTSRITKSMARATAAGERVLKILEAEPEIEDSPTAKAAIGFKGQIAFESVSFAYRAQIPALSEIDLVIDEGEQIALVGPTGAGKSTLISLIPRFYDPTGGVIRIDGCDIKHYTLDSLRGQISIVFQEPCLFADTVAENIAYGRQDAELNDVMAAARKCGVHRVIESLEAGYDTEIGERGGTLSGGQRQCVAIARAMMRDAPIVILDEPLTGIDNEYAAVVSEALARLTAGRTTVTIMHDLSSTRHADRIVCLEKGRIVQEGTYEELLATEGLFRRLHQDQANAIV